MWDSNKSQKRKWNTEVMWYDLIREWRIIYIFVGGLELCETGIKKWGQSSHCILVCINFFFYLKKKESESKEEEGFIKIFLLRLMRSS